MINNSFNATFDSPITAFGISGAGVNTITLTADSNVVGSLPNGFFGFTADTSFTTLTFEDSGGGDNFGLDNYVYKNAPTAVPFGVSTDLSILILGGLYGASCLRKTMVARK